MMLWQRLICKVGTEADLVGEDEGSRLPSPLPRLSLYEPRGQCPSESENRCSINRELLEVFGWG